MPKLYDRLVLGAGTTAACYLSFFPPGPRESVGIIGIEEPWALRGQHYMGQPPHLLMLPQSVPQRPHGFPTYSGATNDPNLVASPTDPFLRSDTYAEQRDSGTGQRLMPTPPAHKGVVDGVKYRTAWVREVTRVREGLKVSYTYQNDQQRKFLYAKQVIVATGPGAPRNRDFGNQQAVAHLYYTGDSYLNSTAQTRVPAVAVEGGSATAAWSVEKALHNDATAVYWFVRKNGRETLQDRFAPAFPAGDRNTWLFNHPQVHRFIGTFQEAQWVNVEASGRYRLRVRTEEGWEFYVDQYIAALGAIETATYLGALRQELKPLRDTEGHLHLAKDNILAYINDDRSIIVIGSGVYKVPRPRGETEDYAKSNEYLPRAARPPEGIPTIIATLATLTRYLPDANGRRWIDVNLGNFSDLDAHFRAGTARAFSHVLCQRLQLVGPQYRDLCARFIADQVIGNRIMKSSPYGIKLDELIRLYQNLDEMDPSLLATMIRSWL